MNDLSLKDQIMEMQRKIHILEEDRTAYRESTQSTINKNRELILQLRHENMKLYRKVANVRPCDEHLIKEMNNFRNMTLKEVETLLEQKVLSRRKRLNVQTHRIQTCRKHLEEMQLQLQRKKQGGSTKPMSAKSTDMEPTAKKLWVLENSFEKIQLKCQEAENITRCYLELKNQLQEESLTFQGQLDSLAADILQHREELHKLAAMKNNSQLRKDTAKAELQQQEESLYKERKKREHILAIYRKEEAECKAERKKHERLAQRAPMQPDELSSEAQLNTTCIVREEEESISNFEEILQQIKEVTGANTTQAIVEWYLSQEETYKRLQEAKSEGILLQLKKEKEQLQQQLQDMKYPGGAKLSNSHQLIQQERELLEAAEHRCDAARKHLDCLVRTLNNVRFGVENLAHKLEQITVDEGMVTDLSPDSEGFVVHLIGQCELKLRKLHKEFLGMDMAAVMETMDKEEFFDKIEEKMPSYNTRIKLPDTENLDPFNDDEESEAEEEGVITREALKRQAQLVVDGHTKRKYATKKR